MNHLPQKVLVVGGAGYIGSHVTQALLKSGHQPIVFDNLSTGSRSNVPEGVTLIHGDILLLPQIENALKKVDAVIHLAALKAAGDSMIHPEEYATHNVSGTINLLNAALRANVKNIVFSSTAAVYGEPQYVPIDEDHPKIPANFYGVTKLQIETLLQWYSSLKGIHYASLRYFNASGYDIEGNVLGLERNPNNLFPIAMEAVVGVRKQVEVYGNDYDTPDGSCIRDYIHVTDLASAHVSALEYLLSEKQNLELNLGTSKGLSVFEVLDAAKAYSGVDFPVIHAARRLGDPSIVLASAQKAKELLGWSAQHSTLETLIHSMLQVYQTHFPDALPHYRRKTAVQP